jgi:tetratricopeptide (TPR) repeat protein
MKNTLFLILLCFFINLSAQNNTLELNKLIESGKAKIDLGDFEGAIKVLNDAVALDSESLKANYYRGMAKYRKGDDNGAIIDLTNSIKISPNNSGLYNQRGIARFNVKNYLGAIDDQNKAIELSPNNINAIYSRGRSKYFLGALEEAMLDYNIAIANNEMEAYNSRGLLKRDLDDYEGAIDDFNNAISFDSLDPLYHHNLGNVLLKTGEFEKAKNQFSIAERLDPSGKSSQYNSEGYYYPSVNLEKTENLKLPMEVDIELFVEDIFSFDTKSEEFFLRFKYALYSQYPADYYIKNSDTIRRDITDLRETVKVDYINSDQTRVDELAYSSYKNDLTGYVYTGSLESTFYHNWDLRNYPFDKQKLQIRFKSSLDSTIFKFNASKRFPAKFNEKMIGLKDGFKIEEITFQNDYTNGWDELNLSPTLTRDIIYPIGTFNVVVSRSGSWLFFKLFIGSFLAFLISWVVFTVPKTDFGSRIDLSVGAIFGAIGNKYFVESTTPAIQVLTKADLINNLVIVMVLFNVVLIIMQNNTKINFWKFEDSKFALIFSGLTMLVSTILIIII